MPAFPTNNFWLYDPADPTKVIKFAASTITTGNVRTATMPDADATIGGGAGGGGTYGRATVDFSTGAEQATVTVADAGTAAGSNVIAGMAYVAPPDGREIAEVEAEQFDVKAGNLVVGVSFDIIVTSIVGPAHGQFYVDFTRD